MSRSGSDVGVDGRERHVGGQIRPRSHHGFIVVCVPDRAERGCDKNVLSCLIFQFSVSQGVQKMFQKQLAFENVFCFQNLDSTLT